MIASWRIEFFNAQVLRRLNAWPVGLRAGFVRVSEKIAAHGPDLGLPHTRALGSGVFEIRVQGREGIGRALFCILRERRILVLSVFVKKTEQIPQHELGIARMRLREIARS